MNLDALAANITSLDPTRPPVISAAERDYFRFYGLNFEENNNNINHHFGRVRCGDFDIVVIIMRIDWQSKPVLLCMVFLTMLVSIAISSNTA